MGKKKSVAPPVQQCEKCGQTTPNYDTVNYGSIETGYRTLCSPCFNAEVAAEDGLEGFQSARMEPVVIADCEGVAHEFHFRTRYFGPGVSIDAFELRDGLAGGYEFQIIGDPEDDLFVLLSRLIDRIRRALAIKHLEPDAVYGLKIRQEAVVRARIAVERGPDMESIPVLVIDGNEIDWDHFGHMLTIYEGWQFKLTIADRSEEI